MNLSELGDRIRNRRNELGLTLDDLAERMGMGNKKTLSAWENSAINHQYPKLDKFEKLSNALECDPEHLLGFVKHPTITTSWIAEQIPLSREAIEILQELKLDSEASQEAQFISDVISFFVKALYTDYGEDSVSFIRALNGLCEQYNGNPFWRDQTISRMNHIYVLAYKEELRETAARIMMEFCKNHPPVYRTQIKDTRLDMLDDNFWREVEKDGNI